MFEYVSVSDIILYLTSKVGPLPSINCTFYGCDHRTHTTKLVAKAFMLFYLVLCLLDIRRLEVCWLLCFFVFLPYPKLKKDWIFSAFCFDHGWNKKRPFWNLFEMFGHCFSLFLLKDQYSLAFRCFIVPLSTDFKILFGGFYLF